MRKIEQQMWDAINGGYNWQSGNTQVVHHNNGITCVFLHGNHIANIYGDVEVNKQTLAKWPTPTTKSRLRALGADVVTRKGITYVDGEAI